MSSRMQPPSATAMIGWLPIQKPMGQGVALEKTQNGNNWQMSLFHWRPDCISAAGTYSQLGLLHPPAHASPCSPKGTKPHPHALMLVLEKSAAWLKYAAPLHGARE